MLPLIVAVSRRLGRLREEQVLRDRLERMTTRQLADIGLERDDIRSFARVAVRHEGRPVSTWRTPVEMPADPMRLLARAVSLRSA
jgi:uncharacterized protein YjiS (DUF1127 family)